MSHAAGRLDNMNSDPEQSTLQEIADHLHDISVILERLLGVQRGLLRQGSRVPMMRRPEPLPLRRGEPGQRGSDVEEETS